MSQVSVNFNLVPYCNAVDERENIFLPLNKQLTKLRKIYKSIEGVGPLQLKYFMTIIRKLKVKSKSSEDKSTTPEELTKQHSVSQMSYNQRTNTMDSLIAQLENTTNFNPNENEFKVVTYTAIKTAMLDSTQRVIVTIQLKYCKGNKKRNDVHRQRQPY